MNTVFMIDLEETIIDSFSTNFEIIHANRIKKFINDYNIQLFEVVSNAVFDHPDLLIYNKTIKPVLEDFFKVKFSCRPICDYIDSTPKWKKTYNLSDFEFISIIGKRRIIEEYILATVKDYNNTNRFILIDDQYDDITTHFPKKNIWYKIINVKSL